MLGRPECPLLLAYLLLACATPRGEDAAVPDVDGDGVPDAEDCSPTDPTAHAGAVDRCNGLDDDCDWSVDEDAPTSTWYADFDRDGFGDPLTTVDACAAPDGYVADATDCDPSNGAIHPGADELCDDVDDDCDGLTDDSDPDTRDPDTWYPDADGDGFGVADPTITACVAPDGYVGNGDDCDDTRADVSPRAPEVCDDADVDEDCDGLANDADDWAAGGTDWYVDADGDGHGAPDSLVWACALGPGRSTDDTDCLDDSAISFPGAPEICDGLDNDCDGATDEHATDATRWYFDADGDAYGDPHRDLISCPPGPPWVANGDDCDDADATRHPRAPETDCDDPTDYNCDGSVREMDADGDGDVACTDCDDADATVGPSADERCDGIDDDCDGTTDGPDSVDAGTWYGDFDGDGYGNAAMSRVACEESPGWVADGTDCDDGDRRISPGMAERCGDGIDQDCDGADTVCLR